MMFRICMHLFISTNLSLKACNFIFQRRYSDTCQCFPLRRTATENDMLVTQLKCKHVLWFWEWLLEYSTIGIFPEHFELCWGVWEGIMSMLQFLTILSFPNVNYSTWWQISLIRGGEKFLIKTGEGTDCFIPLRLVDKCKKQVPKRKYRESRREDN